MLFLFFSLVFFSFLVSSTSIIPGVSGNSTPSSKSIKRTYSKPPVLQPIASLLQTSNLICQLDENNFRCIFLDSDFKPLLKGNHLSSSNVSFSSKTIRYLSNHPLIKHNTIVVADSHLNNFRFKTLNRDGELKAFKQVGDEFVRSRKTVLRFLQMIKSVKLSNFKQLYDNPTKYFKKRDVENVEELLKPFSSESKHILLDTDFDPILLNSDIATLYCNSFDSLVSYLSKRRSFTECCYYVATILTDGLLISKEYIRDSKKERFSKNKSFIPRRMNDSLAIFIRNNLKFLEDPSHLWTVIESRDEDNDFNDSASEEENSDHSDSDDSEDEDRNGSNNFDILNENDCNGSSSNKVVEDQDSDITDNVDIIRKVETESETEMKISERKECKELFIYNDGLVRQKLKRRFDQLERENDDIV